MDKEHKGGAPSKFSEEITLKVLVALERGATYELAANFAGIHYQTLRNWLRVGETEAREAVAFGMDDGEGSEFLTFYRRVKQSRGKAAVNWLNKIDEAAKDNWQAAAWKLERIYPQDYGRTVKEVQGKNGGPIVISNEALKNLTDDELLQLATGAGGD